MLMAVVMALSMALGRKLVPARSGTVVLPLQCKHTSKHDMKLTKIVICDGIPKIERQNMNVKRTIKSLPIQLAYPLFLRGKNAIRKI